MAGTEAVRVVLDPGKLADLARKDVELDTGLLIRVVKAELAAGRTVPPGVVAVVRRTSLSLWNGEAELRGLLARLPDPVLNPGEEWSDAVLEGFPLLGEGWRRLVEHALTATGAKPTVGWAKSGRALIGEIGEDEVRGRLCSWLARVGRPRRLLLVGYLTSNTNQTYDPYNAVALRGIAWLLSLLPPHPDTARALGRLVETSLRKVAGVGPRSPKVAGAGVVALGRIDGVEALGELARLSATVTYKTTLKQVNRLLEIRAKDLGLSRADVEELAVPAYGLTEVGRRTVVLGDATGEVAVVGGKAVLGWRNAAGRTVKSPPVSVRREHVDALKELRAQVKDIGKMLTAQSERLDRQFLARRQWTYRVWRERFLDHPLVGTLARRLLWTVDGTSCGFTDGALRGLDGAEVAGGDDAVVELWHPVGRPVEEIRAWRDRLEQHGVTQPFRQAHREVYLLTDAERATGTYSNRFAAHIVRQHQFNALAAVRGWHARLRLGVDDTLPPPVRELPEWGLRAEFWVEGADHEGFSDAGAYLRLATDQVRFYPAGSRANSAHVGGGGGYTPDHWGREEIHGPLPLDGIPPLVLSEVLRDVDLFIGVASLGNDPTWRDGGPAGLHREYWAEYGFGELSQTAGTRRDLLARLLPRLAIRDRCRIEGRFLHVEGKRHVYRIHLGSGNVLIDPEGKYLCIVPGRGQSDPDGYLPFEGDRLLSVILSKAMLLADDTAITDPTITSQL
ncbi:hypothetical protein SRB5_65860 [Streptomyces sp. RB5]|uniref:DUF4132 domain-containing protein n=1 Tax=Streptomyces smaragdinus TaxID=2585196 RepID=A0A7K0CSB4_9ACTN|nr:DUF4132 domain-containing protein [Streptomyces smaragdinus]MQY16387.1 hypothetical protein [Streptomyces smaragdinus]